MNLLHGNFSLDSHLEPDAGERREKDLYDALPVGVAILSASGVIEELNLAGAALIGRSRDLLLGKSFSRWVAPECREKLWDHLGQCGKSKTVISVELALLAADGSEIPVQCWSTSHETPWPPEVSFRVVFADLRPQRAPREQMIARDLSRRCDQVLGILSHELRTPLHQILGRVQLLLQDPSLPSDVANTLRAVERNAFAQNRVVEDLLEVSQLAFGKSVPRKSPLDLGELAAEVIDSQVAAMPRPASLRFLVRLDPLAGLAMADEWQWRQIVFNLVSNAIKFTPSGGRVEITLRQEGGEAVFTVTDSGIGIEEAVLPLLFERFWQADSGSTRPYRGLGLGLAIVQGFVRLHDGTLEAESPGPGQGATFRVRIPLISLP